VGALNLLRVLRPGGCISYMSTSEVYGDTDISPQHETNRGWVDCTGPRSSYDEGKRCTESILFEAKRVDGVRVKVVRLFNVYGPRTRPDDGRAVSNFVAQALRGDPMTIYGDGSQVRCWGYVDDIMEALERYFWRDGTDFPGPLNIGSDHEVAVIDIARYVQSRVPGSLIQHLPPAPQDPVNRRPDLSRAAQVIPGWSCRTGFAAGIDKTIAWFEANAEAAMFQSAAVSANERAAR
jgi:UDP-glucose 4-epimerase